MRGISPWDASVLAILADSSLPAPRRKKLLSTIESPEARKVACDILAPDQGPSTTGGKRLAAWVQVYRAGHARPSSAATELRTTTKKANKLKSKG